ncbi:S-layer homology domain-containing protein, partial [Paenibacillus sepulcri]|nr:S-layer homology domain-containing protein [Paenibacillus sepulcri]
MKNKTIRMFALSLVSVCLLFSSFGVAFGDTASAALDIKGHWAESQISGWIDKGYIKGYEDGSFKPNKTITRAEFSTLINRSFGFSETAAISFGDVASSYWAYSEAAKAVKAGYIKGYEDGTFGVSKPISRQEVAVIIGRLLNLPAVSAGASFQDAGLIAEWAKDAVGRAAASNILVGYKEDGSFKPTSPITRAEAVVTLDRIISYKAPTGSAGSVGPAG